METPKPRTTARIPNTKSYNERSEDNNDGDRSCGSLSIIDPGGNMGDSLATRHKFQAGGLSLRLDIF